MPSIIYNQEGLSWLLEGSSSCGSQFLLDGVSWHWIRYVNDVRVHSWEPKDVVNFGERGLVTVWKCIVIHLIKVESLYILVKTFHMLVHCTFDESIEFVKRDTCRLSGSHDLWWCRVRVRKRLARQLSVVVPQAGRAALLGDLHFLAFTD